MTKKRELYKIEITDTFGGEANYCWIRRYIVKAVSELGAVQVIASHYAPAGIWNIPAAITFPAHAFVCLLTGSMKQTRPIISPTITSTRLTDHENTFI